MTHPVDNENLIPLPVVDNSFFEEKLEQIEEDIAEVDFVDNAHPFDGTYPSSVMDRTLQTPAFNRTVESRVVDLDADYNSLQPTRLEFDTQPDGEVTVDETLSNSPLVTSNTNNNSNVVKEVTPPRRPRLHGLFSCFRPSNNSPDG
jgi:hypothetical protein